MKKRNRLMVCLVAGVLVLAVSATAAFGSVNGYAKYKKAVMALALEEENFSAAGTLSMKLDGQEILSAKAKAAMAAPDYSIDMSSNQLGNAVQEHTSCVNGVYTSWYGDEGTYYQNEGDYGMRNLMDFDADDEMQNRIITFAEIAADTVVGDLKNNFVEVGSKDGNTLYQVNISNSQVPSLVNAGLSLFAYAMAVDQNSDYRVNYEDYDASVLAYYEKKTGETLSADFKENWRTWSEAWWEANQEKIDQVWEVASEMDTNYYETLEKKGGGILYVRVDGTTDYYKDNQAYLSAVKGQGDLADDLAYAMAKDMVLDNVACTFGLDKNDKLTTNEITVTFTTTDADGGHHKLVFTLDATFSGYGTTKVQAPDLTGRTKSN